VGREDAGVVSAWLAEKVREGTPALLVCSASPAVRACLAAQAHGRDLTGTLFRIGGEPFTPAKAAVLASVGARAIVGYSTAETGAIAHGSADPHDFDDVHVYTDRFAMIQRPHATAANGDTVPGLRITSLVPNQPKVMLNVETGDYAELERRPCDCLLGRLGFTTHLSGIRSYEKLTSEGVTFLGTDLYALLEEVLPARFGGSSLDYQLVEEEGEDGLPRVYVVVSPQIGPIDEAEVVAAVLRTLKNSRFGGARLMTDQWAQGNTLRVVRREPYVTRTSKILPLHVMGASDSSRSEASRA
jgi:phenylacetate-coenzyme A ligase PaaK-like adenylate-forming protein